MEEQQNSKLRRVVQLSLVTLILVVAPLMTYFVERKGMQQGQAFYGDLKNNLGQMPADFTAANYANDPFRAAILRGSVRVGAWASVASRDSVLSVMRALVRTEQFQEGVDNLNFITFDTSTDSTFFRNYYATLSPREREKWLVLRGGAELVETVKLPNDFSRVCMFQ